MERMWVFTVPVGGVISMRVRGLKTRKRLLFCCFVKGDWFSCPVCVDKGAGPLRARVKLPGVLDA